MLHRSRFRYAAAAGVLLLLPISIVATLRQAAAQQDEAKQAAALPRAVVDTHDLMHLFNGPLYKGLKQEMQQEPTGDDQWKMIGDRGWQAAEIANLVALRNDDPQWRQSAANLQQAAVRLAETAETRNFDATTRAYRGLVERCNACHEAVASEHAPQLMP